MTQLPRLLIETARYDSPCPECGERITAGSAISRAKGAEHFRCERCTLTDLATAIRAESTAVPGITEVLEEVVAEYRLHTLIGTPTEPILVSRDQHGALSWRYDDGSESAEAVVMRVRCDGNVIVTTAVFPLTPHLVDNEG